MQYIVRTGQITSANSYTALTDSGEGNSGQSQKAPVGSNAIKQIIGAFASSIAAVASAGVNAVLRLSGDGLQREQTLPLAALDNGATDTAKALTAAAVIPTDIPVNAGGEIQVEISLTGADPGTVECAVALGYA